MQTLLHLDHFSVPVLTVPTLGPITATFKAKVSLFYNRCRGEHDSHWLAAPHTPVTTVYERTDKTDDELALRSEGEVWSAFARSHSWILAAQRPTFTRKHG